MMMKTLKRILALGLLLVISTLALARMYSIYPMWNATTMLELATGTNTASTNCYWETYGSNYSWVRLDGHGVAIGAYALTTSYATSAGHTNASERVILRFEGCLITNDHAGGQNTNISKWLFVTNSPAMVTNELVATPAPLFGQLSETDLAGIGWLRFRGVWHTNPETAVIVSNLWLGQFKD